MERLIAYFQSLQKILKYYSVPFRVTRWYVELKMTISKQFKSLNLGKKMRKLCTNEVGGVKMKKKKHILWFEKNVFSLLLFFGCSFCISKMICRVWEGGFSKMIQMCFHWFHKVPNNSLNLIMLNFFSSTFPTCENYVLSYSYFIVFPLIIHILKFIPKYLFDYRDPKVPIPCSKSQFL